MATLSLIDMATRSNGMAGKKKWIKGAIKNPGSLTAQAKRAGESPMEFAREHQHDSGTTGKRARLALTLQGMHHGGSRAEKRYSNPRKPKGR